MVFLFFFLFGSHHRLFLETRCALRGHYIRQRMEIHRFRTNCCQRTSDRSYGLEINQQSKSHASRQIFDVL